MVQLRSCYFCGTTEALSEYETLPERVDGGEASRQVVLCDRCGAKLTNVLAPIVDRLEREPDEPSSSGSVSADDASTDSSESPAPTDRPTQTDVTFGGASASDDAEPSSSSTDPASPGSDATDTTDSTERPDADDPGEASDGDDAGDAVDDDPVDGEADDGPDVGEVDDGPDVVAADSDATDDDSDAAPTDSGDATSTRTDLDRVYHKLLRFLRNREFPIPRTEAERIAQSAYDLTAPEASEVIQRAVDRGVLAERDGELHRT